MDTHTGHPHLHRLGYILTGPQAAVTIELKKKPLGKDELCGYMSEPVVASQAFRPHYDASQLKLYFCLQRWGERGGSGELLYTAPVLLLLAEIPVFAAS